MPVTPHDDQVATEFNALVEHGFAHRCAGRHVPGSRCLDAMPRQRGCDFDSGRTRGDHGHGQGYLDLNFIISELVETTTYRKGPYSAHVGDFSSAGSVNFQLRDELDEGILNATVGTYDFYRMFGATSFEAMGGTVMAAGDYSTVQAFETRDIDRDQIIRELAQSFEHLQRAMENTTEADLTTSLTLFGRSWTAQNLWILTVTHLHEHLGQSIAYARSNGVVPPWSR